MCHVVCHVVCACVSSLRSSWSHVVCHVCACASSLIESRGVCRGVCLCVPEELIEPPLAHLLDSVNVELDSSLHLDPDAVQILGERLPHLPYPGPGSYLGLLDHLSCVTWYVTWGVTRTASLACSITYVRLAASKPSIWGVTCGVSRCHVWCF